MSSPRLIVCLAAAVLLASTTPARALEKWLYYPVNLLVDANVEKLTGTWKRAAAAGYTHVLLADSKFSRLGELDARYFKNVDRVKLLAAELKLEIVPAVFPIGYSSDILSHDVNLVEGLPVKNVPLIVEGGATHVAGVGAPTLPGSDFSDLKKWSWKDDVVTADDGAAKVSGAEGKNARIVQKLKLQPWRQYHVSVRIKTQDFRSLPEIKVLPANAGDVGLQWANLGVKPTQDWTVHHAVFNSREFTDVSLFFGIWGAGKGELWWDDAQIEEVAFLNVTRRPGTPLVVTNADGKPLVEGRDFEALNDPALGSKPYKGEYEIYHTPPVLKTTLPDGTRLLASYHYAALVLDQQVTICLSEPKTYELLRDQARRMHAAWGAKGYMMSHDELRVANWCEACQQRQLTPGQLLADNVKRCIDILREINPGGRIYVWSDMFDPNHNAVATPYYLVNGPLTGSWEGLTKEVIIVPWYYSRRGPSLKFFAERGHKQLIAGYYDSAPEKIVDWLTAARSFPESVVGAMYTTWVNNYADLEKFSAAMDGAH